MISYESKYTLTQQYSLPLDMHTRRAQIILTGWPANQKTQLAERSMIRELNPIPDSSADSRRTETQRPSGACKP